MSKCRLCCNVLPVWWEVQSGRVAHRVVELNVEVIRDDDACDDSSMHADVLLHLPHNRGGTAVAGCSTAQWQPGWPIHVGQTKYHWLDGICKPCASHSWRPFRHDLNKNISL